MKKILVFLFAFVSILLVSCKKDDTIEARRDNPHTDNVTLLNLDDVKNGNEVISTDTSSGNYYTVKVAANINQSLFVFESDLDEVFELHASRKETVTKASVSALSFSAEITEEEYNAIFSNVFAEEGINKDKLGISKDINTSIGVTEVNVNSFFEAYESENVKGNKVKAIYLPTYTERYINGEIALAVYVMVPVYFEVISSEVTATEAFDGIEAPALKFGEDNPDTAIDETLLLASN